mmetsp:Transcript_89876/g.284500  ORF Transcript_89876/g.284500 Transcript_89876/m.284500 type:complete len:207 (-) Transcript_89876:53-673(-)
MQRLRCSRKRSGATPPSGLRRCLRPHRRCLELRHQQWRPRSVQSLLWMTLGRSPTPQHLRLARPRPWTRTSLTRSWRAPWSPLRGALRRPLHEQRPRRMLRWRRPLSWRRLNRRRSQPQWRCRRLNRPPWRLRRWNRTLWRNRRRSQPQRRPRLSPRGPLSSLQSNPLQPPPQRCRPRARPSPAMLSGRWRHRPPAPPPGPPAPLR